MKNAFKVIGDITEIYINHKGRIVVCLIDTEDLIRVHEAIHGTITAKICYKSGRLYAMCRTVRGCGVSPERLHRLILNAPKEFDVDHIHHNTLDNRKSEIRLATKSQNQTNRLGAQVNNTSSGIRGVFKFGPNSWKASFRGKHLGMFKTCEEAEQMVNLYIVNSK